MNFKHTTLCDREKLQVLGTGLRFRQILYTCRLKDVIQVW